MKMSRSVKSLLRRVVSIVCVLALLIGTVSTGATRTVRAEGETSADLSRLIIDKVYQIKATDTVEGAVFDETGFSPAVTSYTGTAYSSINEIKVFPFKVSNTATVTVNDTPVNEDGYVSIDVREIQDYNINVVVSDGNLQKTYHVTVTKSDRDYRGRRSVTKNPAIKEVMEVETPIGDPTGLLEVLKKDYLVSLVPTGKNDGTYAQSNNESWWEVPYDKLPGYEGQGGPVELFTIDLKNVYTVSRIRGVFGPANLNIKQNNVRISVSTDKVKWETPITNGIMRTGTQYDQNVVRYEFGVPHQARYIKFEVTRYKFTERYKTLKNPKRPNQGYFKPRNLRIYQFMVYEGEEAASTVYPAPKGGNIPHQHEDRHQYLASGQATVIERGIPLSGWTPSQGYGRGFPTAAESKLFGYDGPLFYDPNFQNADYMKYNPNALWGISKAPFGTNGMGAAETPRDFVPASMRPYLANAMSFCFGDEGRYSRHEAELYGNWFRWTRQHYPSVILHTNQMPGQWGEGSLKEYLRIAEPDMLCWDDYYGTPGYANPSYPGLDLSNSKDAQKNAARKLLTMPTWNLYRKLTLGGVDGSGEKPIFFGQYLDAFAFNQPQSVKNIIMNTSLLSGAKWLNFFRIEYQFDRSYLFDEDGTPTRGLLEWGNLIDRVHAIDGQLARLNNDWVMVKVGQIGDTRLGGTNGYRMSDFDAPESQTKNHEFGIKFMQVQSLSKEYSGHTGDVVLGYFKTLPGLYESEIKQNFHNATAPRAFMLMNGLVSGKGEKYNVFHTLEREKGRSSNTKQRITLTVDPALAKAKTLYFVDKDDRDENGNARIKPVELQENSFTVTLGGGEANLYFWDTNTTAKASSDQEGKYASFAFDVTKETYWQPAESAVLPYTVEKTFDPMTIDKVTMMERGDDVQAFNLEYLGEDDLWHAFGAQGTTIGAIKSVESEPVLAKGIRLNVTEATAKPGIYDISMSAKVVNPNAETTLTINDNVMGKGLNRFNYNDYWSYREVETNPEGASNIYSLNYDGHFSNWKKAEGSFRFYGRKVELLLRKDQASRIEAAVFDKEGRNIVAGQGWKSGNNSGILSFDLGSENGEYVLKFKKKNDQQAGIDGARVIYKGELTDEMIEEKSGGKDAMWEYVNQSVTQNTNKHYFTYVPEITDKAQIGENNAGFNFSNTENSGWIERIQDALNNNLGFNRTKSNDAFYTLKFNGTAVQLYAGVTPMGDKNGQNANRRYGTLTFTIDDVPVTATALNVNGLGGNGKVSARMWRVEVPAAQANANADHTLKVTVKDGFNRIDYAVVERFYQKEEAQGTQYTVSYQKNGEGSGEVQILEGEHVNAGGYAVLKLIPNAGNEVSKLIVNDKTVPVPDNGRLVLQNIQKNTTVYVTFSPKEYSVKVTDLPNGDAAPNVFRTVAGTTVGVTLAPSPGYVYKEGSLKVMTDAGQSVEIRVNEEGKHVFTMPADNVTVTAAFQKEAPANVTNLQVSVDEMNITLTWNAVEGADGYIVLAKDPGDEDFTEIGRTTETTLKDTAAKLGVYEYKVAAYKTDSSAEGGIVKSKMYADGSIDVQYTLPEDVAALEVTVDHFTMKLNWVKAGRADGYIILRKAPGQDDMTEIARVSETSYADIVKNPGTYTYRVFAYRNAPLAEDEIVKSKMYAEGSGTASYIAPSKVQGLAIQGDDMSFNLTWDAATGEDGVDGYEVRRVAKSENSEEMDPIATVEGTNYRDTVEKAGIYFYSVRAYKGDGENRVYGPVADYVYATALPSEPGALKNLKIRSEKVKDGMLTTLTWDAAENATAYRIYKRAAGETKSVLFATVGETTFSDTNSKVGIYFYTVVAVHEKDGYVRGSRNFAYKYTILRPEAPAELTGFALHRKDNKVTLTWNASENAKEYVVYRMVKGSETRIMPYRTVKGLSFSEELSDKGIYIYKVYPKNAENGLSSLGTSKVHKYTIVR